MDPIAPPSSMTSSRSSYSCIRCADRKVKCDRQRPCSACIKHDVECIFRTPQTTQRGQKRDQYQILNDRLRYYEELLQEQGIDPRKLDISTHIPNPLRTSNHAFTHPVVPEASKSRSPSPVETEPTQNLNKTRVVYGQGRFKLVDNILWMRVIEEFHNPEDALDNFSNDAGDLEASGDDLSYVVNIQAMPDIRPRHPIPRVIERLWQVFVDNVDPLTKVVHIPTLRPAVQEATMNVEKISRGFEGLMFAIYSAAIMSLTDDECRNTFYEPRRTLLSRYITATGLALSRARFMGTTSIVVLQALILHLLSVRDIYEPRAVWSLTGVAVRIAQGMGLERDGTSLGLPPFETEMRRRIWWLLKTHDFRTAELCGLSKFRDIDTGPESTKWPTNVNDDQLLLGMDSIVAESNTLTDICFVAIRYELANFAAERIANFRLQGKNCNQWDLHAFGSDKNQIDKAFRELEEILETKYMRYCDPSHPLHLMTMLMARFSMNVVRFLTHHPRRWTSIEQTPPSERQWIWEVSIKLLEQHNMVLSNPQLKRFAWHAAYFQQWHAFIHVLDTLQANPLIQDADKAWELIRSIYENTPDMIFDMKKPIHVAVGNICLKAYRNRGAALHNRNAYPEPIPVFISQLRRQHQVCQAEMHARDTKRTQTEDIAIHSQVNADAYDMALKPKSTVIPSSNPFELQQDNPIRIDGAIEGDSFCIANGCVDNQGGKLDDCIGTGPCSIITQDHFGIYDATQPISWEQWDAWLAESNVIRPLSSVQNIGASA